MASEIEMLLNSIILFGVFVSIQAIVLVVFIWLLKKRSLWPLIMLGVKGKGSLAVKANRDNGIEFVCNKKPILKVEHEFLERTTGKISKIPQPITKVWHTLKGTSIPIHFCPFNEATNISITQKESRGINVNENNVALGLAYTQGRIDERNLLPKTSGFEFKKEWLLYIAVAIIILILLLPALQGYMGGTG